MGYDHFSIQSAGMCLEYATSHEPTIKGKNPQSGDQLI